MIRIEHLKKEYPNLTPLKDVSVEIHDGDVISIIGPSGTGKSTLLRCINQLEKPTAGKIWLDDIEITDRKCDMSKVRQKMGMVFQSFNLFGHKTVIENIMLAPMDLLGMPKQEAYDTGMKLLRMVGLAEKALNYPDELSGGQKQRIAIARTLAMNPDVILLDEPTSALDPTMVGEVQAVIRNLAKTGKTMMIVTHEMNFARAISNRVFYMDEGGIYEEGSPQKIFDNPTRENTRRFVRRLKVLELNIESRDYDFLGMAGEIERWCGTNQIPPKLSNRVQLAFEETMQLLLPHLDSPHVQASCEYSEQNGGAQWIFRYAGPRLDLTQADEALGPAVLKGITEHIDFDRKEGEPLPDILHVTIREADQGENHANKKH
ncbi:MAG: amino acid ABC transporter ATP-binding protein [Treponema sp.]|nr:amino acid ABC transporter ATP-binding protein [Treponema sp.]